MLQYILCLNIFCQQTGDAKVSFRVVCETSPVVLHDSVYQLENGTRIKFETFKFYVSKIQLFQDDDVVFNEENSFHLIDIAEPSSQNIFLHLNKATGFNKVKFNLGIDSVTNVSGAMGGDLDPTKGMYWTWQSGYVNFKMEGTSSTPKNNFEFHLGGYQYPYSSLQKIDLKKEEIGDISIVLDIGRLFKQVDLAKQKHVMSPGAEAVMLSKQLATCFSIK